MNLFSWVKLDKGLIIASLKVFGTCPKESEALIMFRSSSEITGKTSFSSFFPGSSIHAISFVRSSCPIASNHRICSFPGGAMRQNLLRFFVIVSILLLKKFIKVLLLCCEEVSCSLYALFLGNLATVLNSWDCFCYFLWACWNMQLSVFIFPFRIPPNLWSSNCILTGIVHPKINILSSFTSSCSTPV